MNARSIYCLFIVLSAFYIKNVAAQNIDVNRATVDDIEWNEGTITLTDGKIITGQLKLNTKTGLLGYENGSTSKSFTPRNVLAFTYFDAVENRKRNFLSISYKSLKPKDDSDRQKTNSEIEVPQFFEVLVECKTFALLSTVGRLNIKQRGGGAIGTDTYVSPSTVYSHTETLLILAEDGTIDVVLDLTNTETDRAIFDSKRSAGKVSKSIIEEYTAPYYPQLEAYAQERKLKFKKRDDLIQIIEYYKIISTD